MVIRSESKFLFDEFVNILKWPFILIMFLVGKRKLSDVLNPLKQLIKWFFEPKFTAIMIITNVVIFFASLFFSEQFFMSLIQFPKDIFSLRIFSLISAGFLHANLEHLFGNMIVLFIFGRNVEKKLGGLKTAYIYFGALILSGLFASSINIAIGNLTPGLGASGAIMGLVSAALILAPFKLTYIAGFPVPLMVVGWLAILADIQGIINPTADGIGHLAHLGGFLSIGLLLYMSDRKELKKGLMINVLSFVIGIIIYMVVKSQGII